VADQTINYNFVKTPIALKGKASPSRVGPGITAKEQNKLVRKKV
jgi:hypothetical protein